MWSFKGHPRHRLALRLAAAMAIAGAVGGCFQPLYADKSPTGGPGMRDMLASVEIPPITAPQGQSLSRIAVEMQNELRFGLTGGSGGAPPTHRLTIRLTQSTTAVIIDRNTGRAEFANYGLTASYVLIEIATSKQVMSAESTTRVTFDAPGQEQRFAAARGLKDAESRAAKVIADQIKTRLASYFVAGT
jgi:LPS-assembly lipoprotein